MPDFPNSPNSIELHIEELVLHGLPARYRAELARHVERELAGLLQSRGLPAALARGGTVAGIDAGAFPASPGASPSALGAQVARSLYRGLSQ